MDELFKTNADICIRMAATVKSREIRDQWNELAAHWRSKAEASQVERSPASPAPAIIKPLKSSPPMSPAAPEQKDQTLALAKVYGKTPKADLHLVPSVASSLIQSDEQVALDAIWRAIHPTVGSAPRAIR